MPASRRVAALGELAALDDSDVLARVKRYIGELQDSEEREAAYAAVAKASSNNGGSSVKPDSGDDDELAGGVEAALAAAYATFDEVRQFRFSVNAIPDEALRQRVWETQEIENREQRLCALAALAPQIMATLEDPGDRATLNYLLRGVTKGYQERVRLLVGLVPHLVDAQREEIICRALETAEQMPSYLCASAWVSRFSRNDPLPLVHGWRAETLAWVLPYLAGELKERVLTDIMSAAKQFAAEPERGDWSLSVGLADRPSICQRALVKLLAYLPAEHDPYVVEWALQVQRFNVSREAVYAIAALAPFASREVQSHAVERAKTLPGDHAKAHVISLNRGSVVGRAAGGGTRRPQGPLSHQRRQVEGSRVTCPSPRWAEAGAGDVCRY